MYRNAWLQHTCCQSEDTLKIAIDDGGRSQNCIQDRPLGRPSTVLPHRR